MGKAASLCYFRYKFHLLKIGFMKTQRLLQLLMILASGFFFQCTSDPIPGPPGADGADGIDGIDGVDGVDGTASCISCHSNTKREPLLAAFELSGHGSGTTWQRANNNDCAQCHGGQGYIDFVEFGAVDTTKNNQTMIGCATCHDSHSTFDFENDGPDYALRNTNGVDLELAPNVTIDFEGSSNNCITCHQPRTDYAIPNLNADGIYVVTGTRFGTHYGTQSVVLEGVLGAEIPGSEAYPGRGVAKHRTASSCVECHMGESSDVAIGGHSWNFVEEKCISCHQGVPEIASFETDMATLLALLNNVEGVAYEVDADNNPILDADGNYIPTTDVVVGIILPNGRSNTGIFSDVAGMAAWNYKMAEQDHSRGIHNPGYIKALLKNSIEALQNQN